jgi:hypothetical protein
MRKSPLIATALLALLGSVGAAAAEQLSLTSMQKSVIARGAIAEVQSAP